MAETYSFTITAVGVVFVGLVRLQDLVHHLTEADRDMPTFVFGYTFVRRAPIGAGFELVYDLGDVPDEPREQHAAHFDSSVLFGFREVFDRAELLFLPFAGGALHHAVSL